MADMFDSAPLPKAPAPLLQSEAFARAMTATGLCPQRLGDQTLVTSRRMPGGVVLPQIQRAVLDPMRLPDLVHEAGLGRRPILLVPDRPCPKLSRIGALRLQRDRSVFEMQLDADIGLDAPFQRRLSHAQAQGLTIRRSNLPMDPGHWIFDMATQPAPSRRHLPPSLLTLAYAAANPGGAKLFTARLGQTRIAALLVLIHGQAATWHMSHTTPHGVARGADVLLLWDAARWLANAGVQRFDLGAFDRRNPGANAFRQGAGAYLRRTGGLWLWWPPLGASRRSRSKTNARSPGLA